MTDPDPLEKGIRFCWPKEGLGELFSVTQWSSWQGEVLPDRSSLMPRISWLISQLARRGRKEAGVGGSSLPELFTTLNF